MSNIFRLLKNNPEKIIYGFHKIGIANLIPDKAYLKLLYRFSMKKKLDLKNPKTFNEKIQWLKLNDRKPHYSLLVDKYEAKKIIADSIGDQYIIPTLGVWNKFDDIEFDKLPDQFVLKSTHDSGGVIVCKNKAGFDIEKARERINKSLKYKFYYRSREWPYKNVKPRIIAEKYMANESAAELVEYKLFCFDGKVKIVLVCKGAAHSNGRTNDFMDRDFNRIPVKSLNPISKTDPERPEQLEQLIEIAEKLSQGMYQLRVDTYIVNGKIYVGEITFFHNSGLCKFEPEEWDYKFGEWIRLPNDLI